MMQDKSDVRITAEIWIAAYRASLERQGIPIYINKAGDKSAGAILVKVSTTGGHASLYHRVPNMNGQRFWTIFDTNTQEVINETINKQCSFDPDLWVLEIEDPKGRHLLDEFNF